jgi:PhnB protein
MQLNPYLNFNGNCEVAFKFYEQCLGGKIIAMMTTRESPMAEHTPAEWQDKILHVHQVLDK